MPRPSETIDDATPLDGPRIDVPARIGWLLRTHRTVAGLSLRDMSEALADHGLRVSAATLSRMETEGQQAGPVMSGYDRVLGLPAGQLRTAGRMMFHTFPYGPPPLQDPVARDLRAFTAVCDAVAAPAPTGGDWLQFARYHASDVGYGLPLTSMEPLVARLVNEVGRTIREARMIRHDALITLLVTPYRDLVSQLIRDAVADPQAQIILDLASIISDAPCRTVLHWAGELLCGPSRFHVQGASAALQNMLVGNLGLTTWRELLPYVERAWQQVNDEPERAAALTGLCAALPAALQEQLGTIGHRPTTPRTRVGWARSPANPHYAYVSRIAREVTTRLDQHEEPLLARLLFEGMFEPRLVRRTMGFWLVALSAFADTVMDVVLEELDATPDHETRPAALRVAAACHSGHPVPDLERLLELPQDEDFCQALRMAGRGGAVIPETALKRGLLGDATIQRQTVYCLGMAGDARLPALAADPTVPEAVRGGARWWLAAGPRLPA